MGFFDRALGTLLASYAPDDDYWYRAVGEMSAAGIPITPEGAMKVSAFYRGVDLLSTSLAMLPLNIYRRLPDDQGADVAREHPLFDVLHRKPNAWQDSFRYRRQLMRRLILKGNGYSFAVAGARGPFDQLRPITNMVQPKLLNGRLSYAVTQDDGQVKWFSQDEIFHLCGASDDGIEGVGIVQWAKDSLGLARATESYASRLFSQGPLFGAVLELPTKPDDDTKRQYRESFRDAHAGVGNAHGLLVTWAGAKVSRTALTGEETQFIASRKFSIDDIARWLGVPPHMIGSLERSTNNNIEQQGQEFVTYSLGPWLTLWEQAINDQLITRPEAYYAEFVRDALVRGDIAARWQAYQIAVSTGTYTRNEVRKLENKKKLEGLDEPLDPAYLAGKRADAAAPSPPPPRRRRGADDEEDDESRTRAELRAVRIAQAAAARVLRKEVARVQALQVRHARDEDAFVVAITEFYARHVELVEAELQMSHPAAAEYCAGQADQLVNGDWAAALERWASPHYAAGVAAIALEDAA